MSGWTSGWTCGNCGAYVPMGMNHSCPAFTRPYQPYPQPYPTTYPPAAPLPRVDQMQAAILAALGRIEELLKRLSPDESDENMVDVTRFPQ